MRLKKLNIALVAAGLILAAGCGGQQGEKAVMGPEETVEAFCRAVAGGDFAEAADYCDLQTMKSYIDERSEAWDMLQKKDSSAVAIASAILSEADIKFEDTVREDNRRHISFTISFMDDIKKKTATVKKEGDAWKVEAITDRI